MYLVFDTETTGLPADYKAPVSDSANWPRLVQLAWQLYDPSGMVWETQSYVIKPEGFIIPDEVAKIHRVSQERAEREGVPLAQALEHFLRTASESRYLVGHNIQFDEKIVGAELFRLGLPTTIGSANYICTMKASVDFCRLPKANNPNSFKWPNLAELYRCLFREDFSEAHDALVDVRACARCFFELKNRGVIKN
jgi:DNA polymerase III epsilon subunit-like protein